MNTDNRETWRSKDVIDHYCARTSLQPAEQIIFTILAEAMPEMRMLDIGVGAGRTTRHFSKTVQEYVGVDYSEGMVEYCRDHFKQYRFEVADVREMAYFEDEYFDFILFSYNGLDCVDHEGRLKALREINRICKKGGHFAFSSHNRQSLESLFHLRWSFNPFIFYKRLSKYSKLKHANRELPTYNNAMYSLIKDGSHDYGLTHYYISPNDQARQLMDSGFSDIRFFSNELEKEITNQEQLSSLRETWIYYLTTKMQLIPRQPWTTSPLPETSPEE